MRIWAFLVLFLMACGSDDNDQEPIRIACAANLEVTMDSLVGVFEKQTEVKCEVTAAASGILYTQIEQGAPYDIFISANQEFAEELYEQKKGLKPKPWTKSSLVFVFPNDLPEISVKDLLTYPRIYKIAIADPEIAPYGKASLAYLNSLGLADSLEQKIVYGDGINQINAYLTTGAVEAGFTSYSFVAENHSDFGYVILDSANNDIYHYVMEIDQEEKNSHTSEFIEFLYSEESSKILAYFGYSLTD